MFHAADSLWDTFNQQFDATMNITSGILDSEKNLFMIGDNGIKATIGAVVPTIFETLWQTQQQLPNRVFFYLYTRANDIVPQQLYIGDIDTLQNSNFDMRKETKIVTHGWLSSWQSDSCTLVRDGMHSFLKKFRFQSRIHRQQSTNGSIVTKEKIEIDLTLLRRDRGVKS